MSKSWMTTFAFLVTLALVGCPSDPGPGGDDDDTAGDDPCNDDGYVSEGGGALSFVQDDEEWVSCQAVGEIYDNLEPGERQVLVKASAYTEDAQELGWEIYVYFNYAPEVTLPLTCTGYGTDPVCSIQLTHSAQSQAACAWQATNDPDGMAMTGIEVTLEEITDTHIVGTFSAEAHDMPTFGCGETTLEDGSFEAPILVQM